jgi:hypothetical protein
MCQRIRLIPFYKRAAEPAAHMEPCSGLEAEQHTTDVVRMLENLASNGNSS